MVFHFKIFDENENFFLKETKIEDKNTEQTKDLMSVCVCFVCQKRQQATLFFVLFSF